MNDPARSANRPGTFLQIAGDPTTWGLAKEVPVNPGWTGPVALPIILPARGTLVLSPARAGGLVLSYPDEQNGWMPAAVTAPQLYIPTVAGMNKDALGYLLAPPDNDTVALIEKLIGAMGGKGSTISVALGYLPASAVLINGAVLPFAVVLPAS